MDQAVNQTLNNRNRKSVNADKIQQSLRLENIPRDLKRDL